jgi:hypothetical protein
LQLVNRDQKIVELEEKLERSAMALAYAQAQVQHYLLTLQTAAAGGGM